MKNAAAAVLATALGTGILSVSTSAHALGPLNLEIGLKAGEGTNPSSGPNPLGFGIGGRAGVSILGLYGGVSVIDYLGSSQSEDIGGLGSVKASVHTLLYGVEGGYGISLLNLLTLRAQLGVGNAGVSVSTSASGSGISASGEGTHNGLYLEPGVTGMVSFGMWFVGADINALILTDFSNGSGGNSTNTAMTIHGQVGITL